MAHGDHTIKPALTKPASITQLANVMVGLAPSPAVAVAAKNASGNAMTPGSETVTPNIPSGSNLLRTLSLEPIDGIRTFYNGAVNQQGQARTLTASSTGLTSTVISGLVASAPVPTTGGSTYFISPAGSDTNDGISSESPWATPNHPLNCGDVIEAAPGAYSFSNFYAGKWGTVTCAEGKNVAWLRCTTFDTCKMSITAADPYADGMLIDQSYWGVQGWEVTASSASGTCFVAYPSHRKNIHHIVFANDICNGAGQGGFGASSYTPYGVDYFAVIGSIAYNTSQGSTNCTSGISIYEPVASDSLPGTHIYFAGNFVWDNVDANRCGGTAPTDGEGIMLDSLGHISYSQQVVVDNNISIFNGGRGVQSYLNTRARIYIRHNTAFGNNTQPGQASSRSCGEISLYESPLSEVFENLAQTTSTRGCAGNTIYAYYVISGDATDKVHSTWAYSSAGHNFGSATSSAFSFGPNNVLGRNPSFANPVDPGAPNCGRSQNVPNCMAALIANFTPKAKRAAGYGFSTPGEVQAYDALFPKWLCNVNLPNGLVTASCLTPRHL
jgi:hypothetical protein